MEAGVLAILVWLCSCTCRMPGTAWTLRAFLWDRGRGWGDGWVVGDGWMDGDVDGCMGDGWMDGWWGCGWWGMDGWMAGEDGGGVGGWLRVGGWQLNEKLYVLGLH